MQYTYGAIEAGGTKFVCAVATAPNAIIDQIEIPTTTPDETLDQVVAFFERHQPLVSVGIASFGPLNLDRRSSGYGSLTHTPKTGWQGVPLARSVGERLRVPVAIDTDVNGAALGEWRYGAGRGLNNMAYMSVGTGVGIGVISDNALLRGFSHPEAGHTLIPRLPGDNKPSTCSYHDNCLEGLASGTALQARYGQSAKTLHADDAWDTEAQYLSYGLMNVILLLMPERVILGGGVMQHPGLLDAVQTNLYTIMHDYVPLPADDYIVAAGLGSQSGITGALLLAQNA